MLSRQAPKPIYPALDWRTATSASLLQRIRSAQIVGMGGAGYPTHLKLAKCLQNDSRVVLANGVECEPGVSADETLLSNYPSEVCEAIQIAAKCLDTDACHLAISSSHLVTRLKQEASGQTQVHLIAKVPSYGEERTLIRRVLQRSIPAENYPASAGILVLNVATLFAIYETVCLGIQPTQRIMTVDGSDRWVADGTPLEDLLGRSPRMRNGGPCTGSLVASDERVALTMNAVSSSAPTEPYPCIHCGWCTEICPLQLPVEQMVACSDTPQNLNQTIDSYETCFECGACVKVCPSQIPILDHIRDARQRLTDLELASAKSTNAQNRFERRNTRLQKQAEEQAKKRVKRANAPRAW